MAEMKVFVQQDSLNASAEGTYTPQKASKLGYAVVMDFYTQMAIEGRVYQVKAATISLPGTGDVPLADAAAEMCADAASGTTMIPVYTNVSCEDLLGTLNEFAGKSVATVSTVGDAFVPLNLLAGGPASVSTARVDEVGGVTVTVELATTTLRHWSWSQPIVAGAFTTTYDWQPRTPPVLVGPRCYYVQITATGAGPEYYAHFDYIELPTANIS